MFLRDIRKILPFPMKNLLLNSLLLLMLLSSCSPGILKNYRKKSTSSLSRNDFYPFFPSADSTLLFNMQIDFRKNHFSGFLIIKSTEPDVYRIGFATHFGMSVFDLEFDRGSFKVNYCMEALNKKNVIRLLENDFRILLFQNLDIENNPSDIYRNKNNPSLEINRTKKLYYLKDIENETLLEIEAPNFFRSLSYSFSGYIERFPSVIRISHSKVGVRMGMERIRQEPCF